MGKIYTKMKYRLNTKLQIIKSPIVIVLPNNDGGTAIERRYSNGEELIHEEFDEYYLVEAIEAVDNHIVLRLKVNDRINDINWAGEEQTNFF